MDMDYEEYEDYELTMKQRPHVVILGAGASVAAIPNGDRNGKKISAMAGFIDKLGMSDVIKNCNLTTTSDNLEDIYMEMYDKSESDDARKELEGRIEEYFSSFQIPDKPTAYDFLLLGLTKKDLVATFNWDPLLIQAYDRCARITSNLPKLAFLHGNVGVKFCEKEDLVVPSRFDDCPNCGGKLSQASLLYPVKNKDYNSSVFIKGYWDMLKAYMGRAYRVTIFGYSAPKSDVAAMDMLRSAWGNWEKRNLEEIEIIDIADEDKVRTAWDDFIHTHHYSVIKSLFESAIGQFPRRTCELLFDNTLGTRWIDAKGLGFTPDMDFADIRRLLTDLMVEEENNDGSKCLSDPYVLGADKESSERNDLDNLFPVFAQMNMFVGELMRMIDEGQNLSVEDVCDHIEAGDIVEYVKTMCGFKNINVSVDNVKATNDVLKNFYVSENEARKVGIENNGLIYLLWLINEDTNRLLYNMKFNDIEPDMFRN